MVHTGVHLVRIGKIGKKPGQNFPIRSKPINKIENMEIFPQNIKN